MQRIFYSLCYFLILITLSDAFANQDTQTSPTPLETAAQAATTDISTPADETSNLLAFREQINRQMQNSAQWHDDLMAEVPSDKKAAAKGYLRLGWLPRNNDWSETEVRFTVSLSLPNWKKRLKLIVDNDADEFDRLPFETENQAAGNNHQGNEINASLQYLVEKNDNLNIDHRIGISRTQLYARSSAVWEKKIDTHLLAATAGLEYYYSDGFGQFIKLAYDKELSPTMSLNWSANLRHLQSEPDSEVRSGLYFSYLPDQKRAMIVGINGKDAFNGLRSYTLSYRYREQFLHSWLYYEIEPFLEYRELRQYNDEVGIALRFIGYYGQ